MRKELRIVYDTNVYISAALKGGFTEQVIRLAGLKEVVFVTSSNILLELKSKLEEKFSWSESRANFYINTIKDAAVIARPGEKLNVVKKDLGDNKILECALAGRADLIVSSGKHLLKLKSFRGIVIVHPKTPSWIFPKYFKRKI